MTVYTVFDERYHFDEDNAGVLECLGRMGLKRAKREARANHKGLNYVLVEYDESPDGKKVLDPRVVDWCVDGKYLGDEP